MSKDSLLVLPPKLKTSGFSPVIKVKQDIQTSIVCLKCNCKPQGQKKGGWLLYETKCIKCNEPLKLELNK